MKNILWIPFGCLITFCFIFVRPELVHCFHINKNVLIPPLNKGKTFLVRSITDGDLISQDIPINELIQTRIQNLALLPLHLWIKLVNLHKDPHQGSLQATMWLGNRKFIAQSKVQGAKEQSYHFVFSDEILDTSRLGVSTRLEIRGVGIPADKAVSCYLTTDLNTGQAYKNDVPLQGALRFTLMSVVPAPWYRYWSGVGLLCVFCLTCTLFTQIWLSSVMWNQTETDPAL